MYLLLLCSLFLSPGALPRDFPESLLLLRVNRALSHFKFLLLLLTLEGPLLLLSREIVPPVVINIPDKLHLHLSGQSELSF